MIHSVVGKAVFEDGLFSHKAKGWFVETWLQRHNALHLLYR
jgi:hypothetical protein